MARSLKTLNPLAGYLVWSGSAWVGVGDAPNARQARAKRAPEARWGVALGARAPAAPTTDRDKYQ